MFVHLYIVCLWLILHYSHGGVVVTETLQTAKPKVFIIWLFTEKKIADSCLRLYAGIEVVGRIE